MCWGISNDHWMAFIFRTPLIRFLSLSLSAVQKLSHYQINTIFGKPWRTLQNSFDCGSENSDHTKFTWVYACKVPFILNIQIVLCCTVLHMWCVLTFIQLKCYCMVYIYSLQLVQGTASEVEDGAQKPKKQRLASLDAFRGWMDVCWVSSALSGDLNH